MMALKAETEGEKLINEYIARFGGINIVTLRANTSEELSALIKAALESGEPIPEPEFEDGVDY